MNSSSNSIPKIKQSYIAIIIMVIVLIIVVTIINKKFNFLPKWLDLTRYIGLTKDESGKYWEQSASLSVLKLNQNDLPGDFPRRFGYSIMFDMIWYDTRVSPLIASSASTLPYRHILHRGSSDLRGNKSVGCAANPLSAVGDGLPQTMNPGFFADPTKNDLIIFIDTMYGSNPLRESIRIPNIPLDKPQRFCLNVYENYFEVFKGCKLLVTKTLKGIPRLVDPEIYGLTGSASLNAKVMNLRLWSTPLNVQTIVYECNASFPDFGIAPSCGTGGINPSLFLSATQQLANDTLNPNANAPVQLNDPTKC